MRLCACIYIYIYSYAYTSYSHGLKNYSHLLFTPNLYPLAGTRVDHLSPWAVGNEKDCICVCLSVCLSLSAYTQSYKLSCAFIYIYRDTGIYMCVSVSMCIYSYISTSDVLVPPGRHSCRPPLAVDCGQWGGLHMFVCVCVSLYVDVYAYIYVCVYVNR